MEGHGQAKSTSTSTGNEPGYCHFMQFEAMKHVTPYIRSWIDRHFTSGLTGRRGQTERPQQNSDLTSCDLLSWVWVKHGVYHRQPTTQDELKQQPFWKSSY